MRCDAAPVVVATSAMEIWSPVWTAPDEKQGVQEQTAKNNLELVEMSMKAGPCVNKARFELHVTNIDAPHMRAVYSQVEESD